MSLIIQGNRSGMLALHVGDCDQCIASGGAHSTSLIQKVGRVDPSFIDSVSMNETRWQIFRRSARSEVLGLMLNATVEQIDRLKANPVFGALQCVQGATKDKPWALDVVLVAEDALLASLTDLLRTALLDDHLSYVFVIDFAGFAERSSDPRRPTLDQFKAGAPCHFESASFTLKYERHPDSRVTLEGRKGSN